MSSWELWTEPTKIGHIFRKQSTFQKISFIKVDLLFKYSLQKKNEKYSVDFWCRKMTLTVQILQTFKRLFIILVCLTMIWFSKKTLFSIYADMVWCPTWSKNLGRYLAQGISYAIYYIIDPPFNIICNSSI